MLTTIYIYFNYTIGLINVTYRLFKLHILLKCVMSTKWIGQWLKCKIRGGGTLH